MSIQIDFMAFKNFLNKNNVLLFDTQLRIAHFRYNNYIKNQSQIGGSNNFTDNKYELLNRVNKKKNCLLSHFIDSLLTNNLMKTCFIINSLNTI